MTAEPYICVHSIGTTVVGEIQWFVCDMGWFFQNAPEPDVAKRRKYESKWQRYADFEREKLNRLRMVICITLHGYASEIPIDSYPANYCSNDLINYSLQDYETDSESNRLIKRAEFLKAVCEKEGVEWLPQDRVVAQVKVEPDIVKGLTDDLPPREFYTKAEVDERLCGFLDMVDEVWSLHGSDKEKATEFRDRFGL